MSPSRGANEDRSHRPVLVPGGALVLDEHGRVIFALREEALCHGGADTSDITRMAVAHFAAMHADAAGLVDTPPEGDGSAASNVEGLELPACDDGKPSEGESESTPGIVAAGSLLDASLLATALGARERGDVVVPVIAQGSALLVGPRLDPAGGPCILCLRRAVAPNRQAESALAAQAPRPRALEVPNELAVRAIRAMGARLRHTVLELDPGGTVRAQHFVRSFADCSLCGSKHEDPNHRPPRLGPCPKHPEADTGARISPARVAVARYEHLVSPLTGAVRHIREVETGAPGLIHVHSASHAMTMRSKHLADFIRDGQDQSGGKGSTADQARASALCESLERFAAVFRGSEVDEVAKIAELDEALAPNESMLFSEAQYRSRRVLNKASSSPFQYVPRPFDPGSEVAWSKVWCLATGTRAYVPTGLLYFGFTGPGHEFCYADSNGLAAGQTLEEAVLQGLLELVERDAVALWWYNRSRYPAVDVRSFCDDYIDAVVDHYGGIGRDVWVLDVTSDLGIPVFVALSARREGPTQEIIFGFGAHLDPGIALRRCVTEMNQLLATVIRPRNVRAAQLRGSYDEALDWWDNALIEDHTYLTPHPDLKLRTRASWGYEPTADVLDDIRACLGTARRHGLRVFVRDMTRADLEIAVAKVIVPGLRHFWRRLGPGRLYEAPVAMGKADVPTREEAMNPVSLFV